MPFYLIGRRGSRLVGLYVMEYYSAIKENEIGSFVQMWLNLGLLHRVESEREETNTVF